MGCFNTTGFISQLPILGGDEVVCFIASSKMGRHMTTPTGLYYPSSLVAPYFLPIYGEYNEYGALENIKETPITKMLCKYAGISDIEKLVSTISASRKGEIENVKLPTKFEILSEEYSIGALTLLFEYKSVYDEITKEDTYLTAKFNAMYEVIDKYVKLLSKLEKYKILPKLPFNIASEVTSLFNELEYDNDCPQELVEEFDTLINECRYNRVGKVFCGDNTMFLFDFLSKEDELTAMIEGKEELRKFLNLYALYQGIPSYFKFSKTAGEQQYEFKDFQRIYNVVGKKLKVLIKEEKAREEEE